MSLAFWNGRVHDLAEVAIDPRDSGFLFGDGLFETLRVDDGRARDVDAHLDRLLAGLGRIKIDLPEDRDTLAAAVAQVAWEAPRPVARLRITITRGLTGQPTRLITAAPYEPPGEDLYCLGVAVRLLPQYRIDSGGSQTGLKSLSYQMNRLALHHAESLGAYEALLVNEQDRVVEGARSNVALVFPEGVFTPPKTDGCLPGTVRRRLIERGEMKEWPLVQDDLAAASEVVLMNSLIGVLPVSRINTREVPLGPVAARMQEIWEELTGPGPSAPRQSPA